MSSTRKHLCTALGVVALTLAAAAPAFAHPGHGAHGLSQGLAHPFGGMDHLLAMIAVGLWASLRGGKALWAWPAAFASAMLAGFALGQGGTAAAMAEPAVLASVIVIGAAAAAALPVPTVVGAALIGLFGLAHGYAHGVEAPGATLGFPLGFLASTAALHLVGLGAGLGLSRLRQPLLIRLLGAGAAAGGLVLAFAA